MLQRINSSLDEELLCGDGFWTRDQLEEMDRRFVAATELAFAKGGESRAAAAATYVVNGKQHTEAVIEAAWCYLRTNMDAGIDVSFAEVLARCPGITSARVRAAFKERLTSWILEGASGQASDLAAEEEAGRRAAVRAQERL